MDSTVFMSLIFKELLGLQSGSGAGGGFDGDIGGGGGSVTSVHTIR